MPHTLQSVRRLECTFITILAIFVLAPAVRAQNPNGGKSRIFTRSTDISIGLTGQTTFARTATSFKALPGWTSINQESQFQSPSAGALITLHHEWKPYAGYNLNFSYTRFTQLDAKGSGYSTVSGPTPPPASGSFGTGHLDTRMYELTAAYAVSGPRTKRFRTFGQIGGGGLFFAPVDAPSDHLESRPALVFGVGGDYDLSRHFALRAEYRGLFYKMPNLEIYSGLPAHRFFTVTNTPALSLVYRFENSPEDLTRQTTKGANFSPGSDLSVGLAGQMTFARNRMTFSDNGLALPDRALIMSQSPSAGTLVTFHKAFTPYVGYKLNFGYTRFTQVNSFDATYVPPPGSPSAPTSTFIGGAMKARMYELSAAYAFDGPRSRVFRSFGEVGAGELVFHPIDNSVYTGLKTARTLVFGVGGDYDLNSRLSIRAEYRGLFYRMPSSGNIFYFPSERLFTLTNMPAISLVYRLGRRHDAGSRGGK